MKTYFYVIEWHDGSGKTSGLVDASLACDAFAEVKHLAQREIISTAYGLTGVRKISGDIITFNKVDDE